MYIFISNLIQINYLPDHINLYFSHGKTRWMNVFETKQWEFNFITALGRYQPSIRCRYRDVCRRVREGGGGEEGELTLPLRAAACQVLLADRQLLSGRDGSLWRGDNVLTIIIFVQTIDIATTYRYFRLTWYWPFLQNLGIEPKAELCRCRRTQS